MAGRLLSMIAAPSASSAYGTLHGSVQHVLYHAGQIAVLKKGSGS